MSADAPTTIVFLALGSNLGDRPAHLAHAVRRLAETCRLTGLSDVYESEPVGHTDQPRFLNMVVRVATRRTPRELLELALAIEAERGRERTFQGAPRTLDIDVVLHGDTRVDEPGLRVPHPRMTERPFVLVPLLELAPAAREPGTGRRYAEYLTELGSRSSDRVGGERGGRGLKRVMTGEELLDGENA